MDEPSVTELIKEGERLMEGLKSVVQNILVKQCGGNQAGDDNVDNVIKQITRACGDDEDTDIEDADQDIGQRLECGLRSVIDLTKKSVSMSNERFMSLLRAIMPDKLMDAECKGCQMRFAVEVHSNGHIRYGFDYHEHCIEKCPLYEKLNLIRHCRRCSKKFLDDYWLTFHNYIVHNESDVTVANGSHNKDKAMKRKANTSPAITAVLKRPSLVSQGSSNSSQPPTIDLAPFSERSSASMTSQLSPPSQSTPSQSAQSQVRHHKNSTVTHFPFLKRGAKMLQSKSKKIKPQPSFSLELSPRKSTGPLNPTKKCEDCLSSILYISQTQTPKVYTYVYKQIQQLISGQITADKFASRVEGKLNSPPRSVWIPFLKDSLPYLRQSSVVEQLTIGRITFFSTDYDGDCRGRYEIEKILDVKIGNGGHRRFLVKWWGWDHSENTWELESSVQHASGKIDAFYRRPEGQMIETTPTMSISPTKSARPVYMPEEVYDSFCMINDDNVFWISCPYCSQQFSCGSWGLSGYSFSYYVHCVEECLPFKELELLRECNLCPLVFLNRTSFLRHRKSHKNSKGPSF